MRRTSSISRHDASAPNRVPHAHPYLLYFATKNNEAPPPALTCDRNATALGDEAALLQSTISLRRRAIEVSRLAK
jgi:hypothetical protein